MIIISLDLTPKTGLDQSTLIIFLRHNESLRQHNSYGGRQASAQIENVPLSIVGVIFEVNSIKFTEMKLGRRDHM